MDLRYSPVLQTLSQLLAIWFCSIQRKSDKLLKKLERQDKRKGRAVDPDLDWLISHQATAMDILAGLSPCRKYYCHN